MQCLLFISRYFSYEVIYSIFTSANRNESNALLLMVSKLHRYDKCDQKKDCHSALDFFVSFTFKCHYFR